MGAPGHNIFRGDAGGRGQGSSKALSGGGPFGGGVEGEGGWAGPILSCPISGPELALASKYALSICYNIMGGGGR